MGVDERNTAGNDWILGIGYWVLDIGYWILDIGSATLLLILPL
jgi:hypothetical protein